MKKLLLLLLTVGFITPSGAQPYSAFVDVRQEFYAFDNGSINKLDHLTPVDYKIGKSSIAFIDNQRNFKLYRDGLVTTINENLYTVQFSMSDNLILYRSANMISVIDGNDVKLLSGLCRDYAMGDSVVMFYDINRTTFNGYYNGEITELETYLLKGDDFPFSTNVKASDNIGAYINFNDVFKAFYHNKVFTLEEQRVRDFAVGRNVIAYNDINNQFKIFYKGETYKIDAFSPKSYQVGDNLVAFVNYEGYFKIFYNGKMYNIGFYEPQYQVKDFLVAYEATNGFFKVFHEGETKVLENYYPPNIEMQYNSLAYTNQANMLRLFSQGKIYDVTNQTISSYRLDYDVLQYKVGFNRFKIFAKGEEY
jgi:hypothetical protein